MGENVQNNNINNTTNTNTNSDNNTSSTKNIAVSNNIGPILKSFIENQATINSYINNITELIIKLSDYKLKQLDKNKRKIINLFNLIKEYNKLVVDIVNLLNSPLSVKLINITDNKIPITDKNSPASIEGAKINEVTPNATIIQKKPTQLEAFNKLISIINNLTESINKLSNMKLGLIGLIKFKINIILMKSYLNQIFKLLSDTFIDTNNTEYFKTLIQSLVNDPDTLIKISEIKNKENQEQKIKNTNIKTTETKITGKIGIIDGIIKFFNLLNLLNTLKAPNLIKFKITIIKLRYALKNSLDLLTSISKYSLDNNYNILYNDIYNMLNLLIDDKKGILLNINKLFEEISNLNNILTIQSLLVAKIKLKLINEFLSDLGAMFNIKNETIDNNIAYLIDTTIKINLRKLITTITKIKEALIIIQEFPEFEIKKYKNIKHTLRQVGIILGNLNNLIDELLEQEKIDYDKLIEVLDNYKNIINHLSSLMSLIVTFVNLSTVFAANFEVTNIAIIRLNKITSRIVKIVTKMKDVINALFSFTIMAKFLIILSPIIIHTLILFFRVIRLIVFLSKKKIDFSIKKFIGIIFRLKLLYMMILTLNAIGALLILTTPIFIAGILALTFILLAIWLFSKFVNLIIKSIMKSSSGLIKLMLYLLLVTAVMGVLLIIAIILNKLGNIVISLIDNIGYILGFIGGIIVISLLLGVLGNLAPFVLPGLAMIIPLFGIMTIIVLLVYAMGILLKKLVDLKFDDTLKSTIKNTVSSIMECVFEIIKAVSSPPGFERQDSDSWMISVFKSIGGPFVAIIQALASMLFISIMLISVIVLKFLGEQLIKLGDFNINTNKIINNINNIMSGANSVIAAVNKKMPEPKKDNSKKSFMQKLSDFVLPDKLKTIANALGAIAILIPTMTAVGTFALLAEQLQKINDFKIDKKTIDSNIQNIITNAKSLISIVSDDNWGDISIIDIKVRLNAFNNISSILKNIIDLTNNGEGPIKMIETSTKFIQAINSADLTKLQTAERIFKNISDFSNSIRGDFDELAATLNEKIAPLLEELKELLKEVPKKMEENTNKTLLSNANSNTSEKDIKDMATAANPNATKEDIDKIIAEKMSKINQTESALQDTNELLSEIKMILKERLV